MLERIVDTICGMLWGWHVLLLILLIGISVSLRTGFFQIRNLFFWLKASVCGKKEEGGVSSFQALTAALGGSIGTGNIVGVAAAITVGGAGALFWMWISAFFGMMTVFTENLLSAKFKNANGALGYISKVEKVGKPLAIVYALGCFLSSLGMGNMVQTNALAAACVELGVPQIACAVVVTIVLFFVAVGGFRFAVKITDKLVPLMTLIFLAASAAVLWISRENLPAAVKSVFDGAFSLKAGVGGTAGMLIAAKSGISRGIFTNEAGLGSSAFAYEEVKGRSPVEVGCMGIFQVFADTIVMCTVTGLCILCTWDAGSGIEGANLTFSAFEAVLGEFGSKIVCVCTVLFAFATMVTWCCYGREGLFYVTSGKGKLVYAMIFAAAAGIGCFVPLDTAFVIGDAFNGLMAIPNLLALFYFSDIAVSEVKNEAPSKRIRRVFNSRRV